jgi:hypothetical protein
LSQLTGTWLAQHARGADCVIQEAVMLWTIVVLLLILWLLGFTMHVAGGLIHILLVIALVVIVMRLLTGRRV